MVSMTVLFDVLFSVNALVFPSDVDVSMMMTPKAAQNGIEKRSVAMPLQRRQRVFTQQLGEDPWIASQLGNPCGASGPPRGPFEVTSDSEVLDVSGREAEIAGIASAFITKIDDVTQRLVRVTIRLSSDPIKVYLWPFSFINSRSTRARGIDSLHSRPLKRPRRGT